MTKEDEAQLAEIRAINEESPMSSWAFLLRLLDESRDALATEREAMHAGYAAIERLRAERDEQAARVTHNEEAYKIVHALLTNETSAVIRLSARVAALEKAGNGLLSVIEVARARNEEANPDAYYPAWRQWRDAIRARETPAAEFHAIGNPPPEVLRIMQDEYKRRGLANTAPVPPGHCNRCPRCGWTFAKDRTHGCVPGDCSYRPIRPFEPRTTCAGCGAPYESAPVASGEVKP